MWIVPFRSESGDSYIVGPFDQLPTEREVLDCFRKFSPDEADYCESLGMSFEAYQLGDQPGTLSQSSGGVPCPG